MVAGSRIHFLAVLLITSGCLGPVADGAIVDAGEADAGPPPSTCVQVAAAMVARDVRCGKLDPSRAGPDEGRALSCEWYAQAAGRVTPSAPGLDACLADLAGSCLLPNVRCNTEQLFTGTIELGQPCFGPTECLESLFCDNSTTCPAHCAPRIELGQPVTDAQAALAPCVAGAFALDGACAPLVPLGGSCKGPGGRGLICAPPYQCLASEVCGLYAGAGEDCNDARCGDGLMCTSSRVCQPLGARGDSCERSCQSGLRCPAGRCELPPPPAPVGAACTFETGCEGGFCESGTCAPRRAVGGACTTASQCVEGLRCVMTTRTCAQLGSPAADCHASNECLPGLYCGAPAPGHPTLCLQRLPDGSPCLADECQNDCLGAGVGKTGRCGPRFCR